MSLATFDLAVLCFYLVAVTGYGCWFLRKTNTSDDFMAAGRSLPGWAVGLSIFGSYVSSISFLANPGKSYAGNWNPFVFSLSLPLAALVAVWFFVPFYRRSGAISAYAHFEDRFGPWARTYAVVCYLLLQFSRLGTILYLLALAVQPLIGSDIRAIIVVTGVLVTIYPLLGGTKAVIWTGVVQSLVLIAGTLACLAALVLGMPEGPEQIVRVGMEHDKFSLGSFDADFATSTFWVVLLYGIMTNLQNFGIDQSYVQRYITARSDKAAARSVWLGGLLYIPVGAAFFFIGTALFAFYQVHPESLPSHLQGMERADAVFPYFIRTELPVGVTGLVIAAICAAAMDSNLNCSATLVLCDIYKRYFRPQASERESMRVLHWSTLIFGALSTAVALAMIHVRSALDAWWELAGIFSGGMLGLFLLGFIAPRAGSSAALLGVVSGTGVSLWMTFSTRWTGSLEAWRSPFHPLMVLVVATVVIVMVGYLSSFVVGRDESDRELLQ